MMKSSLILLSLENERLVVWKIDNNIVCVRYENCEIKDGCALLTTFGRGSDFEDACRDYLAKIRGKTLVFNAYNETRREVTVLG